MVAHGDSYRGLTYAVGRLLRFTNGSYGSGLALRDRQLSAEADIPIIEPQHGIMVRHCSVIKRVLGAGIFAQRVSGLI